MSGGVDSSVAAALLKQEGYEVFGVFMQGWSNPQLDCQWREDRRDAARVAAYLDIPFHTLDFSKEYYEKVVSYLLAEYQEGRTPNPDVMCNKEIKFGLFFDWAMAQGADYVATGHYIQIQKSKIKNQNENVKFKILAARDTNKDQSYFLWTLTQRELARTLFPIGEYTKPEVRELARSLGLATAEKKDSQGICFVGELPMREFLKDHIPVATGPVLTTVGERVGTHEGAAFYTIGQRHGVGAIGGGVPYYVVAKDMERNEVRVAVGPHDEALYRGELVASNINWISGTAPRLPLKALVRIRYRQPLQAATLMRADNNTRINADHNPCLSASSSASIRNHSLRKSAFKSASIRVIFGEGQRAITPGQSVVFYSEKKTNGSHELLGGGVIS